MFILYATLPTTGYRFSNKSNEATLPGAKL